MAVPVVAFLLSVASTASAPLLPALPADAHGDRLGQLAACLVHLQQHHFPASGQVTVIVLRPLEARDVLGALRGMTAPRRVLLAEDVADGPLDTNNFLADLFVVMVGTV